MVSHIYRTWIVLNGNLTYICKRSHRLRNCSYTGKWNSQCCSYRLHSRHTYRIPYYFHMADIRQYLKKNNRILSFPWLGFYNFLICSDVRNLLKSWNNKIWPLYNGFFFYTYALKFSIQYGLCSCNFSCLHRFLWCSWRGNVYLL